MSDIARRAGLMRAALRGSTLRFAVAESCTGGQLAALFARDAALGPHLERGFVVYSADAKRELLGVAHDDVERCEAVNPRAADAMAEGALSRSRADIAIALTGFCGPRQGGEEIGLVYIACVARGGWRTARECHFGDLGREAVLDHAVAAALEILAESVERHGVRAAVAG
ncbi:MAG TPA: nicotinamide-nucleotide amidohydrolase family protein [Sphingomonadaceae bacterium]|nr:nicotinamide-nucleotide amidohydrolase family protein [Sphingomonadaceae bacterium]